MSDAHWAQRDASQLPFCIPYRRGLRGEPELVPCLDPVTAGKVKSQLESLMGSRERRTRAELINCGGLDDRHWQKRERYLFVRSAASPCITLVGTNEIEWGGRNELRFGFSWSEPRPTLLEPSKSPEANVTSIKNRIIAATEVRGWINLPAVSHVPRRFARNPDNPPTIVRRWDLTKHVWISNIVK
jgi:hypothetical protein